MMTTEYFHKAGEKGEKVGEILDYIFTQEI